MPKKKVPRYYVPPPDYLAGCAPEQALCYDFIIECLELGWAVYPEYPHSQFDMLLVAEPWCLTEGIEPGTQVGVQAKMSLNSDLLRQLVDGARFKRRTGPDYMVALTPGPPRTNSEKANHSVLEALGFGLLYVYSYFETHDSNCRRSNMKYAQDLGKKIGFQKRVPLPELRVWTEPGVASPMPITKWKLQAVAFCLELAKRDGITRAQCTAEFPHISFQRWTESEWLVPSDRKVGRGFVYVLNTSSTDRPDLIYPNIRAELEKIDVAKEHQEEKDTGDNAAAGREPSPGGAEGAGSGS